MITNDDNFSPLTGELETAAATIDPGGNTTEETSCQAAQLSLHALSGDFAADTFRLMGTINEVLVRILVDGGSTHNFIQATVARSLGLELSPIDPFKVLVGSGQELLCSHICYGVPLLLQGTYFTVDLFVLDLRGATVVLGAQWLKGLGPVLMNYTTLHMTFFYNNTCVELKGDSPTTVGYHHIQRLARLEPEAQFFSLHISSPYDPPDPSSSPILNLPDTTHLTPDFIDLLTRHSSLFSEPSSLPPITIFPYSPTPPLSTSVPTVTLTPKN